MKERLHWLERRKQAVRFSETVVTVYQTTRFHAIPTGNSSWNPKFHCRVRNNQSLIPIVSQTNPVRAIPFL